MKSNEITRELLQKCRGAFVDLHFMYGFDFEKPFGITSVEGSFTVAKVMKAAAAAGPKSGVSYIPGHQVLVLITYSDDWNGFLTAAVAYGKVKIEERPVPGYHWDKRKLAQFYNKSQFEEVRKKLWGRDKTYLIWQDVQYLKIPPLEKEPTEYGRYELITPYVTVFMAMSYVERVSLRDKSSKGELIEFSLPLGFAGAHDPSEIIDRSGNLIYPHRSELRRRAAQNKREHDRQEFLATDHSGKVEELQRLAAEWKTKILKDLAAAETGEQLKSAAEELSRWKGLTGSVLDLEFFRDKVQGKQFSSNAECEQFYQRIRGQLTAWRQAV